MIDLDPRASAAYSALGLVEHKRGNFQGAIARYHEVSLCLFFSLLPPVTGRVVAAGLDGGLTCEEAEDAGGLLLAG